MRGSLVFVGVVLAGCVGGCKSESKAIIRTTVDSNLRIGDEIDEVRVETFDLESGSRADAHTFVLGAHDPVANGTVGIPFSFNIQRNRAERFLLTVSAWKDARRAVEHRVIADYGAHARTGLRVFLGRECLHKDCTATDQTCYPWATANVAAGECGPIDGIDATDTGSEPIDAGSEQLDAHVPTDAGDVTDEEASTSVDSPTDAGDAEASVRVDPDAGSCPAGYRLGGGGTCEDIDECAEVGICPPEYPCEQTAPPGYTCRGQLADWVMASNGSHVPTAPRYDTTSTAGVVIDRITGLAWQRVLDSEAVSWSVANAYCNGLELANASDWRLPTLIELMSIVDDTATSPIIDLDVFVDTPADGFWSSSFVEHSDSRVYLLGFEKLISAGPFAIDTKSQHYVRCVRREIPVPSSTPDQRYIADETDQNVVDVITGLTWRRSVTSGVSYPDAEAACSGLGDGWRVPGTKELWTLVTPSLDANREVLAALMLLEASASSLTLWSSTPTRVNIAETASTLTIGEGTALSFWAPALDESGSVRCVR